MAKRYELPDAAWDLVADIFSESRRNGRPRANDRLMLNVVLWGSARALPGATCPSASAHGQSPASESFQQRTMLARARGLPIGRSVGKHLRILAIVARC